MQLDDARAVVAAVVAPTHDAVVALKLLAERVLAAGEDEAHVGGFGGAWVCGFRSAVLSGVSSVAREAER